MNYYAFSALVNFFTSVFIAGLVFKKTNRKNITSMTFFLFALAVSVWSLNYFVWQISQTKFFAEIFSRFLFLPAIWIPSLFFHFIVTLADKKDYLKKAVIFNYILSIFFSVLMPFNLFLKGVDVVFDFQFWPKPGPIFPLFLLYFLGVAIAAHFILWRAIITSLSPKKTTQLKYVFHFFCNDIPL